MFYPVVREKVVKNAVLFGGLRLFHDPNWRKSKETQDLRTLSRQLTGLMQMKMETERVVVGVPVANYQVKLIELDHHCPQEGFHRVQQVLESAGGYFIKTKRIA